MSTTYLNRPVFEFLVDWMEQPSARVDADLRMIDMGFGVPRAYTDRTWPAWGWEFNVNLDSAAEIREWETFHNAGARGTNGSLRAFWLPVPHCPLDVVSSSSSTVLIVTAPELLPTWEQFPALHIRFEAAGVSPVDAEVTDVVDNEDGTLTVTFTGGDVSGLDSSWRGFRLALVRHSTGEEAMEYGGEQAATAFVSVVEVPLEYAEAYEGTRVIWFYEFTLNTAGGSRTWVSTSLPFPVDSYQDTKMTHEGLHRSADGGRDGVTIITEYETTDDPELMRTPLGLLFPHRLAGVIEVKIQAYIYGIGLKTVFQGRAGAAELDGKQIRVTATSMLDLGSAGVPTLLLQRRCNYMVFSGPCGLVAGDHEVEVTFVAGSSPLEVIVTAPELDGVAFGYFAEGLFKVAGGVTQAETRFIVHSTAEVSGNSITLTLDRPLRNVTGETDAVIRPGCDGRFTTCSGKFSNVANFGGHRYAPDNLTLRALPQPQMRGGKK